MGAYEGLVREEIEKCEKLGIKVATFSNLGDTSKIQTLENIAEERRYGVKKRVVIKEIPDLVFKKVYRVTLTKKKDKEDYQSDLKFC